MMPRFGVRLSRSRLSPLWLLRLDPNQHQLELADPLGRKLAAISVPRPPIAGGINHTLYSYSQGVQRGHMLVAWLGDCVTAVDLLSEARQTLWVQPTTGPKEVPHPLFGAWMVGGRNQMRGPGPFLANEPLPLAAASSMVCFQQEKKLLAVDPLAPADQPPLWVRTDIPANADLWGDEELLFVTPPGQREATVLSSLDGRRLGSRPVPDMKERLLVLDRRILCWKTAQEACQAVLLDPWTQQTLWSRSFPAKSQPWPLPDEGRLAVLAPSGALLLLDLQTGEEVFHASVDPEPNLDGLVVLASGSRYVVIANRPFAPTGPIFFGRQAPDMIFVHGRLTALDRQTGATVWTTEVLEQQLRLDLPMDLPVLAFYTIHQKQEQNKQGNIFHKVHEGLMCLDLRTGAVLHQSTKEGISGFWYDVVADVDAHTISIITGRETVRLDFGQP